MHWFELGIANRDDYDDFANMSLSDERLYALRSGDRYFNEYKDALKTCIFGISEVYRDKGDDNEAEKYAGFAKKIP